MICCWISGIDFSIIRGSSWLYFLSKNKLISFVKDFPSKFIDLDKKKIDIEPVTINKNNEIIEIMIFWFISS